jgi:4-diphosphocytidyl-2-C-methyl-D-erythritol kinase
VPFFLSGLAFAEGRGRGEKIRPLKGIKKLKLWHVLVVPKLAVSTPFIYQRWDSLAVEGKEKAGLTIPVSRVNIITLALVKKDLVLLGRALCNSLQEVTVKFYPEVSRVTKALVDLGAQTVLMSGSGPAVFTLCTSQREALFLRRELDKQGHSWRVFLAQTA